MSRRSPWVVLVVLTLVGSLLAVSAGPAAGKDGEADDLATYSACVWPGPRIGRLRGRTEGQCLGGGYQLHGALRDHAGDLG